MVQTNPTRSSAPAPRYPFAAEQALEQACAAWSDLLGESRVLRSLAAIQQYARTTLPDAPVPLAVLRPESPDQLPTIVRIASEYRIPVYSISRGKNWGWGDACPTTEGQVILDLSKLNRIVDVNEELGYAVVEPGVTQGQLARYLEERCSAWRLDWTGAGPDTSLLGNILERGITVDERISRVSSMQVLLADGTVVRTGYGHFAPSRVTHVARWGIGPALDGLFSQSNLGIVTEIGFWLHPRPAHTEIGYFTVPDARLEHAVEALRPLRLRGLFSALPLLLVPGIDGPTWAGLFPLEGSTGTVAAQREEVMEILSPVAAIAFPQPAAMRDAEGQKELLTRLGLPVTPLFRAIVSQGDLSKGLQPTPEALLGFLGGPEIQHPTEPPTSIDPLDHDYGFYFLWLTCPALGRDARTLVDLVRSLLAAHGFPPLLSLRFTNGRAIVLVLRIVFDRKDEERSAVARACRQAILDAAMAAGYPPARIPSDAMDRLDPADDSYWRLVRRIKGVVDPENILAPGRYFPPADTGAHE
jgi:4-cresol dehydrogenase (hydroxylating)